MSAALLIARCFLAAVFAVAALGKLSDRAGFRRTLAEFRTPAAVVAPLAWLIPLAEITIAALLIPASTAQAAAFASVILLGVFSAAISRSLARGEEPDCGCFGAGHSAPVTKATLARNGGLAVVAAAIAIAGPGEAIAGIELSAATAFAAAVVIAIGLLGWISWQLFRQNGRLLERVRVLEAAVEPRLDLREPESVVAQNGSPPQLHVHRANGNGVADAVRVESVGPTH